MASGLGSLADPATISLIIGWRERAWRNAEDLVRAKTPAERDQVAQRIENQATAEALLMLPGYTYVPPLTSTKSRDDYCAVHYNDPAPIYPFSTTTK